jgi:hypothetical protein
MRSKQDTLVLLLVRRWLHRACAAGGLTPCCCLRMRTAALEQAAWRPESRHGARAFQRNDAAATAAELCDHPIARLNTTLFIWCC